MQRELQSSNQAPKSPISGDQVRKCQPWTVRLVELATDEASCGELACELCWLGEIK